MMWVSGSKAKMLAHCINGQGRSPETVQFGALAVNYISNLPSENCLGGGLYVALYAPGCFPGKTSVGDGDVYCNGNKIGHSEQVAELSRQFGDRQINAMGYEEILRKKVSWLFRSLAQEVGRGVKPFDLDTHDQDTARAFGLTQQTALELFREKSALFPRSGLALLKHGQLTPGAPWRYFQVKVPLSLCQ